MIWLQSNVSVVSKISKSLALQTSDVRLLNWGPHSECKNCNLVHLKPPTATAGRNTIATSTRRHSYLKTLARSLARPPGHPAHSTRAAGECKMKGVEVEGTAEHLLALAFRNSLLALGRGALQDRRQLDLFTWLLAFQSVLRLPRICSRRVFDKQNTVPGNCCKSVHVAVQLHFEKHKSLQTGT